MLKKIILALVILAVLIVGYFYIAYIKQVDLGDRTVSVIIKPGDSFMRVAGQLLDEGVVTSKSMLYYPARWREIDKKLVPGRYDFTGKNSCKSVLKKLEDGDFLKIRFTLYEGATIWKAASLMQQLLEIDSTRLMALNTDTAFLDSLGLPCLEGYLYPETYFIPWGTPIRDVVREMVSMYHNQTDSVWPEKIPNDLSRDDLIVLASIVEAEAKHDDEKSKIASVYHNRLKKNMRLDADPTVIYGLGGLDRPLWKKDLRKETPYNTYRMRGLPPTPINSPGLAAIEASLHPDSTGYFYFVADGTGRHIFSRTNNEHNRARWDVKKAIKERQEAARQDSALLGQ